MTTTTRQIEWTTSTGHDIAITMVAQYQLDRQGRRKTTGRMDIDIDTTIDGKSLGGMARLWTIDHPEFAAKISRGGGKAVALTQANLDRYNAALADLESIIHDNNAACDINASKYYATQDASRKLEQQMAYGDNR